MWLEFLSISFFQSHWVLLPGFSPREGETKKKTCFQVARVFLIRPSLPPWSDCFYLCLMLSGRPFLVVFSPETDTEVETLMQEIEASPLDEINPLHLLDLIAAPIATPQVTGGKLVTFNKKGMPAFICLIYNLYWILWFSCLAYNLVGTPASSFYFSPTLACFFGKTCCLQSDANFPWGLYSISPLHI